MIRFGPFKTWSELWSQLPDPIPADRTVRVQCSALGRYWWWWEYRCLFCHTHHPDDAMKLKGRSRVCRDVKACVRRQQQIPQKPTP